MEQQPPTSQPVPEKIAFYTNFDKIDVNEIRKEFAEVIGILNMEYANPRAPFVIRSWDGGLYLRDPYAIQRLTKVVKNMKLMLLAYKENTDNITILEKKLLGSRALDLRDLILHLNEIGDRFVDVMANQHNFKDKVNTKEPWEDQVKKKLMLNDLTDEEQAYYDKVCVNRNGFPQKWKQNVFFWTASCVKNKNDIHLLLTGNNNTGKTNTTVCHLAFANKLFREFWHVFEDSGNKIEVHKFSMRDDVIYDPDPSSLDTLVKDKYYQTVDLTEGMGAAVNLRSMDKEVVKLGVKVYRMRAHRNIVAYEYQVSKRPPALLMERFNVWIHKMNWYWGVLSMPSAYYRKTDPLYLKELDDLRDDNQLSKWFANKHTNPNYIMKFRAPKLTEAAQIKFDKYREEADKRIIDQEDMQKGLPKRYNAMVKRYWEEINGEHRTGLDIIDLRGELMAAGLRDSQINTFMLKYNNYDAIKRLEKRKQIVLVDENG